MAAICAAELGEWHRRTNEDGPIRPDAVGGNNREFICRPNAKPMRFNLRVYRESVNRDTNRRRFTAGRHRRTMSVIVAFIMMTALGDKHLISQYLLAGANDYIVKPFEAVELLARVEVVLRRTNRGKTQICYGDITVNLDEHVVKYK